MVAIDTDVAIFLCNATEGNYDPAKDPQPEKLAIFRIFIYTREIRLTPTVLSQITKQDQRTFVLANLLPVGTHNIDANSVDRLVSVYKATHSDLADCKILAEATVAKYDYLLSFDRDLIRRLSGKTQLEIIYPSIWWNKNAPSKGSRPVLAPHWSNPKVTQDWYRW